MSKKEFIEKLIEIMDTEEEISMSTVLEDVEEWDSLAYVSFLALCKDMDKNVQPGSILGAKTVEDLYRLIA